MRVRVHDTLTEWYRHKWDWAVNHFVLKVTKTRYPSTKSPKLIHSYGDRACVISKVAAVPADTYACQGSGEDSFRLLSNSEVRYSTVRTCSTIRDNMPYHQVSRTSSGIQVIYYNSWRHLQRFFLTAVDRGMDESLCDKDCLSYAVVSIRLNMKCYTVHLLLVRLQQVLGKGMPWARREFQ